jgi:hypothetical protein
VTDRDKLRVMLGHWISHNEEHAQEFLRWVDRAGPAAEALGAAARGMNEASRALGRALEQLGGPLSAEGDAAGHAEGRSNGKAHE